MSQNLFAIIIIFLINFSFAFSLSSPIYVSQYKNYNFDLDNSLKYIICYFINIKNITNSEIVFRFSNAPKYSTKFFLYYSKEDVSKNIDSLISYNEKTGEFFNSIYSTSLDKLDKMNYEIILNSNNLDAKYLLPGYFYTVISLISNDAKAEYSSEFFLFNFSSSKH